MSRGKKIGAIIYSPYQIANFKSCSRIAVSRSEDILLSLAILLF